MHFWCCLARYFPYLYRAPLLLIVIFVRFIRFTKPTLFRWSTWRKSNRIRITLYLVLKNSILPLRILRPLSLANLIWTQDLLRSILKTLLSFFFSTFSQHLMIGLLTWWFTINVCWIVHFVYHWYSFTWILVFGIVVTHQYVLGSEPCDSVISRY